MHSKYVVKLLVENDIRAHNITDILCYCDDIIACHITECHIC